MLIRTTLAATLALTLAAAGSPLTHAQSLPTNGSPSALRADNASAIPFIEVHLTGDIPVPGKVAVPPGSRVDDVLLGRLLDLTVNGFPASAVQSLPLTNPRTGVVLRTSQAQAEPDGGDPVEAEFDLRNIRLIRADGTEIPTDLMAYRMGGALDLNPPVFDGDVVHVRRRHDGQRSVSVSGAVRTELTLPWRQGDTLENLLAMAGGISSLAVPNRVVIVRANGRAGDAAFESGAPVVLEISLDETPAHAVPVMANDRVVVPVDQDRRTAHTVTVDGEVMHPGVYPVVDGRTTLAELLDAAGGPTPNARMHDVRVRRTQTDPIDGELLRASDQPLESLEALREEILMDQRIVYADLRNHPDGPDAGTVLFDGDVIRVEKDERTVRLMGQVGRPGYYGHADGASVGDYVARAGGYGPAADTARVFVIKSGGRGWVPREEAVIESGDIVFVDRVPFTESTAQQTLEISRQGLELEREVAETNRKRTNVQVILTVVNSTVAVITTYILIRNRY